MYRLQRIALVMIGITLMLLGPITEALAAFDNSAKVTTMSVTTITVAAPTGVDLGKTTCTSSYDATTGVTTTTMHARLDWNASTTTRGVSGYLVTVHLADGTKYPYAMTNAATTALTGDYDASIQTQNIRVSVSTLTSYGWTAESPISRAIRC
jgi:hypothetical protein